MIGTKRVTIKEIAKQAGVSAQTVSRVVNKEARVAHETRTRVQAIIDATGYRPNKLARALIRGRTNTIGIISSGIGFYGPAQTITGIETEAKRLGYSLSLGLLQDHSVASISNSIEEMLAQNVAGIVWAAEEHVSLDLNLLNDLMRSSSVPLISNGIQPHNDVPTMRIDNYHGGCIAVQHLVEQGYRCIATITGPKTLWSALERVRGWRNALADAGLPATDDLIAEGDWTPESGDRAIRELLQRRPDIDAVFVGNDQMAVGVLSVAAQLGRSVPSGLGVVGYDDLPSAAYFSPALTTVRQDIVKLGQLTMQALDQRIKGADSQTNLVVSNIDLQPELIVRHSTQRNA